MPTHCLDEVGGHLIPYSCSSTRYMLSDKHTDPRPHMGRDKGAQRSPHPHEQRVQGVIAAPYGQPRTTNMLTHILLWPLPACAEMPAAGPTHPHHHDDLPTPDAMLCAHPTLLQLAAILRDKTLPWDSRHTHTHALPHGHSAHLWYKQACRRPTPRQGTLHTPACQPMCPQPARTCTQAAHVPTTSTAAPVVQQSTQQPPLVTSSSAAAAPPVAPTRLRAAGLLLR